MEHKAAGTDVSPSGAGAFLARRLAEVAGLVLALIGFACMAALASYNPMGPGADDGLRATVSSLLGRPGAVAADHLYRGFGAASWLIGVLLLGWGWQLAVRRRLTRPGLLLIVTPLVLGLACFALAVLRPFSDWPQTNVLNGGIVGDVIHGTLVPKATAAIGLDLYWIGLLAALFAVAGALFLVSGGAALGRWVGRPRLGSDASPQERGSRAEPTASGILVDGPDRFGKGRRSRPVKIDIAAPRREKAAVKHNEHEEPAPADLGPVNGYRLPSLDLLGDYPTVGKKAASGRAEIKRDARLVESVLADFGVKGMVVETRPGPVVTLYEFEPAPGVKSSQVVGLADDIARSLSAVSARVAVIPGRNVVGIEIPNKVREVVPLRELLASDEFANAPHGLILALGKDISGAPVLADLATMPHLLVAGTTGSGKSVGINTMIQSLLYRLTPDQCRFVMIDPKMLELTAYDGIPHLLAPVVTDPDEAVAALNWTVREMARRYQVMSELGVRNIEGYNARAAQSRKQKRRKRRAGSDPETDNVPASPLPNIVVVVDEIADLMLTAGKDVETAVQRIAQMARAAGIHLIMATQRPSTDVITGTIKANFPTRVSFQVTSKVDSRTVLGEGGAEQLLGQGNMLYMAGGGRFSRVHGAFISDEEVKAVAGFLKAQGEPAYIAAVTGAESIAKAAPPATNGHGSEQNHDEQAEAHDGGASGRSSAAAPFSGWRQPGRRI